MSYTDAATWLAGAQLPQRPLKLRRGWVMDDPARWQQEMLAELARLEKVGPQAEPELVAIRRRALLTRVRYLRTWLLAEGY